MRSTSDRNGVLIVRLWSEANHRQGLRARITRTLDAIAGDESIAVAASADDICALVKGWVDDFAKLDSADGSAGASAEAAVSGG